MKIVVWTPDPMAAKKSDNPKSIRAIPPNSDLLGIRAISLWPLVVARPTDEGVLPDIWAIPSDSGLPGHQGIP